MKSPGDSLVTFRDPILTLTIISDEIHLQTVNLSEKNLKRITDIFHIGKSVNRWPVEFFLPVDRLNISNRLTWMKLAQLPVSKPNNKQKKVKTRSSFHFLVFEHIFVGHLYMIGPSALAIVNKPENSHDSAVQLPPFPQTEPTEPKSLLKIRKSISTFQYPYKKKPIRP